MKVKQLLTFKKVMVYLLTFSLLSAFLISIPDFNAFAETNVTGIETSQKAPVVDSKLGLGDKLSTDENEQVLITNDNEINSALVRISVINPLKNITVSASKAPVLELEKGASGSTTVLLPVKKGKVNIYANCQEDVTLEVLASFKSSSANPGSLIAKDAFLRADTNNGLGGRNLSEGSLNLGVTGLGGIPSVDVRSVFYSARFDLSKSGEVEIGGQKFHLNKGITIVSSLSVPNSQGGINLSYKADDGSKSTKSSVQLWTRGYVSGSKMGDYSVNSGGSYIPRLENVNLNNDGEINQDEQVAYDTNSSKDSEINIVLISGENISNSRETTTISVGDDNSRQQGAISDRQNGIIPQLVVAHKDDKNQVSVKIHSGSGKIKLTNIGDVLQEKAPQSLPKAPSISISSPQSNQEFVFADYARLRIIGSVQTQDIALSRVEVSFSGKADSGRFYNSFIGNAKVDYQANGVANYMIDTAPEETGNYQFDIKAYDRSGSFSTKSLSLRVKMPEANDEIANADTRVIGSQHNADQNTPGAGISNRILDVSKDWVLFDKPDNLFIGMIIVTDRIPGLAPDGLIRRITAIDQTNQGWRATTDQAGLADALIKANYYQKDNLIDYVTDDDLAEYNKQISDAPGICSAHTEITDSVVKNGRKNAENALADQNYATYEQQYDASGRLISTTKDGQEITNNKSPEQVSSNALPDPVDHGINPDLVSEQNLNDIPELGEDDISLGDCSKDIQKLNSAKETESGDQIMSGDSSKYQTTPSDFKPADIANYQQGKVKVKPVSEECDPGDDMCDPTDGMPNIESDKAIVTEFCVSVDGGVNKSIPSDKLPGSTFQVEIGFDICQKHEKQVYNERWTKVDLDLRPDFWNMHPYVESGNIKTEINRTTYDNDFWIFGRVKLVIGKFGLSVQKECSRYDPDGCSKTNSKGPGDDDSNVFNILNIGGTLMIAFVPVVWNVSLILIIRLEFDLCAVVCWKQVKMQYEKSGKIKNTRTGDREIKDSKSNSVSYWTKGNISGKFSIRILALVDFELYGGLVDIYVALIFKLTFAFGLTLKRPMGSNHVIAYGEFKITFDIFLLFGVGINLSKFLPFEGLDSYVEAFVTVYSNTLYDVVFGPPDPNKYVGSFRTTLHQKDNQIPVDNVGYALFDSDGNTVPITRNDFVPEDMDIAFGKYGDHVLKNSAVEPIDDPSGLEGKYKERNYNTYENAPDGFYPYNLITPISGTHANDGIVSSPNLKETPIFDKDDYSPEVLTQSDDLAEILTTGEYIKAGVDSDGNEVQNAPLGSAYLIVPNAVGQISLSYLQPGKYHLVPVQLNTKDRFDIRKIKTIDFEIADWWERSHKTVYDPQVQVVTLTDIGGEVVLNNKTTVRNVTRGELDYKNSTQFAPNDILEYHEQINYPKAFCQKDQNDDLTPEYTDICPSGSKIKRLNSLTLSNFKITSRLGEGQQSEGQIKYRINSELQSTTEFSHNNSNEITYNKLQPGDQVEVIYRAKASGDIVNIKASQTVTYQDINDYFVTEESLMLTNLNSEVHAKASEVKFRTVVKNTSPLKSAQGVIWEVKNAQTNNTVCGTNQKMPNEVYQDLAEEYPSCDYKTDQNGYIYIDYLTPGQYYFVMKDVPKYDDFQLDNETKYHFNIAQNGSNIIMAPAYIKIKYHVDLKQNYKIENRDISANNDSKPVMSGDILDVETKMNYPRTYINPNDGNLMIEERFLYNPIYQTFLDPSRYKLLDVESIQYNTGLNNTDVLLNKSNDVGKYYQTSTDNTNITYHNGEEKPIRFSPSTIFQAGDTQVQKDNNKQQLNLYKARSISHVQDRVEFKYNVNGFSYQTGGKEVWHYWDPLLNWYNCAMADGDINSNYSLTYHNMPITESPEIISSCADFPTQDGYTWERTDENNKPLWDVLINSLLAPGSYETIKYKVQVLPTDNNNDTNLQTEVKFSDNTEALKVVSNTYNGNANFDTYEKYSAPHRMVSGVCYKLFDASNKNEMKLNNEQYQNGGFLEPLPYLTGATYQSENGDYSICPTTTSWKINYLNKGTYYLARVKTPQNYLDRNDNIYFAIEGSEDAKITDEVDYQPHFATKLQISNLNRIGELKEGNLITKVGDHLLYNFAIDYSKDYNSGIAYDVDVSNFIPDGLEIVKDSKNNKLIGKLSDENNNIEQTVQQITRFDRTTGLGKQYHSLNNNPLGSDRFEIYPGSHYDLQLEVKLTTDNIQKSEFDLNYAYRSDVNNQTRQENSVYQGSLIAKTTEKYSNMSVGVPGVMFELHKYQTNNAGAVLTDEVFSVSNTEQDGIVYSEVSDSEGHAVSNSSGEVHLEYLETGNYYLKEVGVPQNYILDNGAKYFFSIANYQDSEPETHSLISNIEIDYQPNFILTEGIKNISRSDSQWSDRVVTKKGDTVQVQLHLNYPTETNSAIARRIKVYDFPSDIDNETEPYIDENGRNLINRKALNQAECDKMFSEIAQMKPGDTLSCYYNAVVNTDKVQILRGKVVEQNHNSFYNPSSDGYAFTYPHEAHGSVKYIENDGHELRNVSGAKFVLRNATTFEIVSLANITDDSNDSNDSKKPYSPQVNQDNVIEPKEDGNIDIYYLPNGSYYLEQLNTSPGWAYDYQNYKSWSLLDLDDPNYLNADIGEYRQIRLGQVETKLGKRMVSNQVQIIQDIILPSLIANGSISGAKVSFSGIDLDTVKNSLMVGLVRQSTGEKSLLSFGVDYQISGSDVIFSDGVLENLASNDHLMVAWNAFDVRTVQAKFRLGNNEYSTDKLTTDYENTSVPPENGSGDNDNNHDILLPPVNSGANQNKPTTNNTNTNKSDVKTPNKVVKSCLTNKKLTKTVKVNICLKTVNKPASLNKALTNKDIISYLYKNLITPKIKAPKSLTSKPNKKVTFYQLSVLIYKYLGSPKVVLGKRKVYRDISSKDANIKAIKFMANMQYYKGVMGYFKKSKIVKKGQFYNILKKMVKAGQIKVAK